MLSNNYAPPVLKSMGSMFTGLTLSDQRAQTLATILETYMQDIRLLDEIEAVDTEPTVPFKTVPFEWKEARFQ
ncbi:hypothetical protein [Alicyclobacillus shizuokensis]|uniref:hypothetical protein n=1 Tax=Alicyclobacillus shizuokensis TaxID=392014 RepID=UPI00083733CD|nr:hypothetical protein [Alicyclobacillus shizuokensis]MCL6625009.1 hypothetical protein [Alicyclobacillus shizuokensis]